jgi:hypothetical protein
MAGRIRRIERVTAPDGRYWRVERSLLPRPPRFRGFNRSGIRTAADAADGAGTLANALPDFLAWVLAAVAVVALLVAAWLLVVPLLVFVLDVLVFLAIAAGGIAIRVFFRRPWRIEASAIAPPEEVHSWGVVGVRASAYAVDSVVAAIRAGVPLSKIDPAEPR